MSHFCNTFPVLSISFSKGQSSVALLRVEVSVFWWVSKSLHTQSAMNSSSVMIGTPSLCAVLFFVEEDVASLLMR